MARPMARAMAVAVAMATCVRARRVSVGSWPAVLAVVAMSLVEVGHVAAGECWSPPVDAAVSDPYREPACRWCAGNRGIEYASGRGDPVRAVAAGVVSFAGSVAGTVFVVIEHANGWRATYGNVVALVARGDAVVAGQRIASAAGALHFGLRDGDRYLDPTALLGVVRGVPRLVPSDGSAAPPSTTTRLVCGSPS